MTEDKPTATGLSVAKKSPNLTGLKPIVNDKSIAANINYLNVYLADTPKLGLKSS